MGRTRRLKAQRRWQRLLDEALGIEAHTAKMPCASCAMRDPEAWVADLGMARKILDALQGRARFFCHEGLAVVGTSYLPPLGDDGQVDTQQLTPCGGFLRWALQHRRRPKHEQTRIVTLLQRRMLTRWLASDDPLAQEWRGRGWGTATSWTAGCERDATRAVDHARTRRGLTSREADANAPAGVGYATGEGEASA